MLPFSAEQFFAVFAAYNLATWPAAVLAYLLGAVTLGVALRGGRSAGRIVATLLAVGWAWNGAAYHIAFFAAINPAARLFGAAFLVQAALLLWVGAWQGRVAFGPPRAPGPGLALILYAAVLYPLLGAALGHAWPAAPSFGVTPCPLTIFTFGVLLLARPAVPAVLLPVPLLWSVIGGSAAVLLGVAPDWMLPVSALLFLALRPWRVTRDA